MPLGDRIVHSEMREARRDRAGQLLRLADHVPQNEDLVAADADALRLQRAHDAVGAVDPGDDLISRSPTVLRMRVLMLSSSCASQLSICARI